MRFCPNCEETVVGTVQTALRRNGSRWRRLECRICGHRFTEVEPVARPLPPRLAAYPRRRLSDRQAAQVMLSDASERTLAVRYGITRQAVQSIRCGKSYYNVWQLLQPLLEAP